MKAGIHPELKETKVHCNGCGTDFTTRSTVDSITVEICSNCHPFYTGKQKLVDTAGRVDKFRARTEQAKKLQAEEAKRAGKKADKLEAGAEVKQEAVKADPAEEAEIKEIAQEIKAETVEIPTDEVKADNSEQ